jgi:IclR family transcriptional regulator, blcABC operon repressor
MSGVCVDVMDMFLSVLQTTKSATKPVPAIVRAKQILDALSENNHPRGVSELARALGLPRSTVHGLCRTLADLGLLVRVNATEFGIGPHVLFWSNAFESQSSMTQAFASLADGLDWAEAVNLSVLSGREVMYIACRQGRDPLGVRFREGLRFPAPFTATGKAILSTMPDEEVVALMDGAWPAPCTPRSVTSVDGLLVELEETRQRSYSIDSGQLREAMVCCGAPVFAAGFGDRAIAGVAIAQVSGTLASDGAERLGDAVSSFASALSRRLGATRI